LGVTLEEITSKSRRFDIVMARCMICHFARKYTKMTLTEIGIALGGRDHSTVIYQIEQYPLRYEYEDQFRRLAREVERNIKKYLSYISYVYIKLPYVCTLNYQQQEILYSLLF